MKSCIIVRVVARIKKKLSFKVNLERSQVNVFSVPGCLAMNFSKVVNLETSKLRETFTELSMFNFPGDFRSLSLSDV